MYKITMRPERLGLNDEKMDKEEAMSIIRYTFKSRDILRDIRRITKYG